MGMFDTVRSDYPLPRLQDSAFQTKDIECLIEGACWLGGTLSEYAITADGHLRVHKHEREWRDDPSALSGGYVHSVRSWSEEVPDVHGDIRIYTTDPDGRFVEFRVRFTEGTVTSVVEIPDARTSH